MCSRTNRQTSRPGLVRLGVADGVAGGADHLGVHGGERGGGQQLAELLAHLAGAQRAPAHPVVPGEVGPGLHDRRPGDHQLRVRAVQVERGDGRAPVVAVGVGGGRRLDLDLASAASSAGCCSPASAAPRCRRSAPGRCSGTGCGARPAAATGAPRCAPTTSSPGSGSGDSPGLLRHPHLRRLLGEEAVGHRGAGRRAGALQLLQPRRQLGQQLGGAHELQHGAGPADDAVRLAGDPDARRVPHGGALQLGQARLGLLQRGEHRPREQPVQQQELRRAAASSPCRGRCAGRARRRRSSAARASRTAPRRRPARGWR